MQTEGISEDDCDVAPTRASDVIQWALSQRGLSAPELRTLLAVIKNFLLTEGMAPTAIEDCALDVADISMPVALTAARWLVVRGVLREGAMYGEPAYWPTCPRLPVPQTVLGVDPHAFARAVAKSLPRAVADDPDLAREMAQLIWNGHTPETVMQMARSLLCRGEPIRSAAALVAVIQAHTVVVADADAEEG